MNNPYQTMMGMDVCVVLCCFLDLGCLYLLINLILQTALM